MKYLYSPYAYGPITGREGSKFYLFSSNCLDRNSRKSHYYYVYYDY